MSHLRPIDRETGKPKAYADYTQGEKLSALMQIEGELIIAHAQGKAVDPVTAALVVQLARGTPKEQHIQPWILAAVPTTQSVQEKGK